LEDRREGPVLDKSQLVSMAYYILVGQAMVGYKSLAGSLVLAL